MILSDARRDAVNGNIVIAGDSSLPATRVTRVSDPYNQTPDSNPYGQGAAGQDPYAAPATPPPAAPPPYAPPPAPSAGNGPGGPYGAPGAYPGGSDPMPPKTDGVSIAALVTSLLCVLAPLGVILGIVGISRTKNRQRKGRGLAIAGIVIGVLMSIGTAAAGAAIFLVADAIVTPGEAKVGQCVDVSDDDDVVVMTKKKCTEEHDAEIVATAKVTDSNLDAVKSDVSGTCGTLVSNEDLLKLNAVDGLEYSALIEDPDNVKVGDHLVCYVEGEDELTKPLL